MTKRAEWTRDKHPSLTIGSLRAIVFQEGRDHLWHWMVPGVSNSKSVFLDEWSAKADAVRWLRATIAEMAAACPEVES